MKEKFINWLIKTTKADTNKISDGYHTFEELYEHRVVLWIKLLERLDDRLNYGWKSKKHFDGSTWKGWFIAGYRQAKGCQITYHLPIKYWQLLKVDEFKKAPEFDGHTPNDVLKRLKKL